MKALGKILGLLFLGLLLSLVALGFAITQLLDPNDYKEEIRQLARDKVNLDLNLRGNIGWSLFPWLGLELTDATLASADTPDKPFADLRLLGLSVRVLPLLRREVQMSDIRVDGLNLHLDIDENGHSNWQGIGAPTGNSRAAKQSTKQPAENPAEPASSGLLKLRALDIDSLIVNSASINYRNAQHGQQFNAQSIQLTTGSIRDGASVPIKLSAYFGSGQPALRAHSELQGELRIDQSRQRYQLENAKISGEVSGEPFNGQSLNYNLQGQLLVDLAAQRAEWTGLKLSVNQLRALGELQLSDLKQAPKLSGGLSIAPVNLSEFLKGLGQHLPARRDTQALSRFELVTRFSADHNSLNLSGLTFSLDDSRFNGQIAITDFAKRALRVQLKGDQLDLDRYLPPQDKDQLAHDATRQAALDKTLASAGSKGSTALPEAPTEPLWSAAPLLPIERLHGLDLQLALSLDQLSLRQQQLQAVELKAKALNGLLSLDRAQGNFAAGSFEATASLDVRQQPPQLHLQQQLKAIPIEALLKRPGQAVPITGLLDLNSNLSSSGNSLRAWVEGLKGNASFVVNNGLLPGANLDQQLCTGIALLNRKTPNGQTIGKDTPFTALHGTFTLHNGVASNADLKVSIPGLAVSGDGDLDLRVLSMDYRLGVSLEGDQRAMADPACQVNKRYVGIQWPIRCRGPFELGAKACRLDQSALGKIAARLAGDKLNEKIEKKLGKKLNPELKNALEGLFKR